MKKILIISFLLLAVMPFMSTGNTFPGTGANDAGIGATAWTNPGNILADENTVASCNAAASSQYLVAKNFSFTIPQNSQILGITVRIAGTESSSGTESMNGQLQNESGTLFGSTKTATFSGTSEAVYTYGASSDTWTLTQATITAAIVNDPDFGCRFWFTTAHNITVDYVTIAIDYATGAGFFRALSKIKVEKLINQSKEI